MPLCADARDVMAAATSSDDTGANSVNVTPGGAVRNVGCAEPDVGDGRPQVVGFSSLEWFSVKKGVRQRYVLSQ